MTTYDTSNIKKVNSPETNLYNLNMANIGGNLLLDLSDAFSSYYNIKAENYYKTAQLYNESVPLYQQIGAQVREQMMAQANEYMNAGVDVSQGTAFKVVSHTQEQGTMKLNEIKSNLDMQATNMRRITSSQATMALTSGIMSSIFGGFNSYTNFQNSTGGK